MKGDDVNSGGKFENKKKMGLGCLINIWQIFTQLLVTSWWNYLTIFASILGRQQVLNLARIWILVGLGLFWTTRSFLKNSGTSRGRTEPSSEKLSWNCFKLETFCFCFNSSYILVFVFLLGFYFSLFTSLGISHFISYVDFFSITPIMQHYFNNFKLFRVGRWSVIH